MANEMLEDGAIVSGYEDARENGYVPMFYEVLDRTPKTVRLIRLRNVAVDELYGDGHMVPNKNIVAVNARPFNVRIRLDDEGRECCMARGSLCCLWDGKPMRFSVGWDGDEE